MGKMNKFPPQQLSLDFDVSPEPARPEPRPFAEKARALTTHRSLTVTHTSSMADATSIVSLCDFRGVREQQKVSKIYSSILSSISHIA
jgi:hypothetical protein